MPASHQAPGRLRACTTCGTPTHGSAYCAAHGGGTNHLGRSVGRGYTWAHRKQREALLPLAIGTACPLCGQIMLPHQRLDLHHSTPLAASPTSVGDAIVHASCNRRGGVGPHRGRGVGALDPAPFREKDSVAGPRPGSTGLVSEGVSVAVVAAGRPSR